MKRLAVIVLAALALLGLGGPAHAGGYGSDAGWTVRLTSQTVCVVPDFVETGSGWRVHQAVANWNAAQDTVDLVMGYTAPGCAVVHVHRYQGDRTVACGYTDTASVTAIPTTEGGLLYPGADVYLTDDCQPFSKPWSIYMVEHELGHALGLRHDYDRARSSVMSYGYNVLRFRGTIGPRDVAALAAVYALPVTPAPVV